jgi:K+-transporting ATPase KdpF subunit
MLLYFCIVIKPLDMNATILLVIPKSVETNLTSGYIIGAIIALVIFGYLFYTLIKPEKF